MHESELRLQVVKKRSIKDKENIPDNYATFNSNGLVEGEERCKFIQNIINFICGYDCLPCRAPYAVLI